MTRRRFLVVYAELEAAARFARLDWPEKVAVENGTAALRVPLPRQGASLLVLEW